MNKQKKIGIAGYGIIGKRRHSVIDNNPNLKVIAGCDRTFLEHTHEENGVTFYKDYKLLLEHSDLDAIFVCMSNDFAAEVTIAGLKKGLHVFCEKPPGINIEQVNQIISEEKKNPDVKLMYGFDHRYHDAVIEALRISQDQELGNIINIKGVYGKAQLITFDQTDWRTKRNIAGGGVLLDQGIHMVDLMRLFAGEFIDVKSFVSNSFWGFDVEDNAYAMMKTDEGVIAMLHSSATQWEHKFSLDITFEKGSLNLGGILTSTKSYGDETLTVIWAEKEDIQGNPMKQTTKFNTDYSWQREVDLFAKIITDQGSTIPFAGSEDALNTMRLVYKIYYNDQIWREMFNIEDPDY